MSTTPAPITREMLSSMSKEELHKIVRDPAKLAEINAYLLTPEGRGIIAEITGNPGLPEESEEAVIEPNPVAEEIPDAVAAEAARVAEQAELTLREEAAKAEVEALQAAGITIYRDQAGNITRLVQEYQVDDEHGNPIGNPTHLVARSWVELAQEQKKAHTQATRAFSRLKNQKTTFNKKPTLPIAIPEVPLLTEEQRIQAALDLNSEDENVVIKADRRLRADQILRDQRQEAINKEERRQREVDEQFKRVHAHDFQPCQANAKLISDYIRENDLVWTLDNLELAFAATGPQLVPVKAPVVEETAAAPNPPVPQVPQAVEPTPPVVPNPPAPVAVAVVTAPPAAPNTPATPRRGVNGGLQPDQSTGQRPIAIPAGLTMKEIMKWTGEQMRKERKNPARAAEIDRVIVAYNKARASRV